MAVITGIAATDVRCVFANGRYAIVAGTTGADHLGVINRGRRLPQVGAVTVFADRSRLYVRRALTGGGGAIVATDAVTHDTGVIEGSR